jgi:hypothetical protein
MVATVFSETLHDGAFIVQEGPGFYSRDSLTVAASQTLTPGEVCGIALTAALATAGATASVAAEATNTGNGVFTIDPTNPVLADGKNGVYRVVCIETNANLGTFEVFDPAGVSIGRYIVGAAAFSSQIKFTIADGATDFVAGDAFSVTVGVEWGTDRHAKALDTAGTDGSQTAACIAFGSTTTGVGETAKATFITRNAEVRASDLTWPGGITAAQKAAAIEQLRGVGIILR